MKTIKTILQGSTLLLLLLSLSHCNNDDTINDEGETQTESTFEEAQESGYQAMNTLFTSFGSLTGDRYHTYADVTFPIELDDINIQADLFSSDNLLYNEVVADYSSTSGGELFVKSINRVAFKPGFYDLTTHPISITHFEPNDNRVIFKTEKTLGGETHTYEYEMQNLENSTKNASEQLVTFEYFTNDAYLYHNYDILDDFLGYNWSREGFYIYRMDGQEVASAQSTYNDEIEVDVSGGNTYRKLKDNHVKINVLGDSFCEYNFSSENENFEVTYFNGASNYTKFEVSTEDSNPLFNLNKLFNSTYDNYLKQTFTQSPLSIQMSYYKRLPVSCMGLEGILFDTDVVHIAMSNNPDNLSLTLDYSRIPVWTSLTAEVIQNTNVIDAISSGTLTVNGKIIFTLSRNNADELIAHYPDYNQDVNAESYFEENVTPLETEIENSIIE